MFQICKLASKFLAMKSKASSLFLLCLLVMSCQGQQSKTITTIDAQAFAEKLKATNAPQLIDVRTPEEYSGGHIDNAVNIDWYAPDFAAKMGTYDKTKPVFVYCKAGSRSAQAAGKLADLGFKEIYNLQGGIMKWETAKGPKPGNTIVGMCDQEFGELLKSNDRVLVDFNAKWCAPCQKMKPYMEKLQAELKDEIKIVPLDADENKTLAEQMKLEGLPTLIIYDHGKEVWRHVGYISEEDLKKQL